MLAIIGGTGLYKIEGLDIIEEHEVETPFGAPSDSIISGKLDGKEILFLPRHGRNHSLLPHEVNYRANIWALKKLGVRQIIGVSATGSLQGNIKPGDICTTGQYFDFIKGDRQRTFFGNGMAAHVSTAEPTCPNLSSDISNAGAKVDLDIKTDKKYVCVDGPRLGTRMESSFFRQSVGADLVGMTNVPEVFLAREAQICYTTIAIATDYDCWKDDPEQFVTVAQVMKLYGQSLEKVRKLLEVIIKNGVNDNYQCGCRKSLECAVMTPENTLSKENKELLTLLKK